MTPIFGHPCPLPEAIHVNRPCQSARRASRGRADRSGQSAEPRQVHLSRWPAAEGGASIFYRRNPGQGRQIGAFRLGPSDRLGVTRLAPRTLRCVRALCPGADGLIAREVRAPGTEPLKGLGLAVTIAGAFGRSDTGNRLGRDAGRGSGRGLFASRVPIAAAAAAVTVTVIDGAGGGGTYKSAGVFARRIKVREPGIPNPRTSKQGRYSAASSAFFRGFAAGFFAAFAVTFAGFAAATGAGASAAWLRPRPIDFASSRRRSAYSAETIG